ncbi:MAG: hypothetical protein GEU80_10310 [Dehalococcoidia bacterium]|nr:hypothetical protein [Dehalococcoidia bacterium]
MSKLRTRIREIGRPGDGPLGFARLAGRDERRHMLVMAQVSDGEAARAAIEAGADVLLAGSPSAVAAAVEAAGSRPVGVRLESGTAAEASTAVEAGADFLVFDDARTEARALSGHDAGRVLLLDDDRSEERLRSLAGLALDAVLAGDATPRMTVRDQLRLRRIVELSGAPLIIEAGTGAEEAALETWRDAGAPLVLVGGAEAVRAVVEAAGRVPAPRKPRASGAMPLVPAASTTASHDHDDDDD